MKNIIILMLSILVLFLAGCSEKTTKAINPEELDKIEIKVLNISNLPEGNGYQLKLINSSSYIIKQNSVYISYPIKKGTGSSWNKSKVEAIGNKLSINPNEEVILNVFIQKEVYEDNKYLDTEYPEIEFVGYVKEVTELNRFQKIGGFNYFNTSNSSNH